MGILRGRNCRYYAQKVVDALHGGLGALNEAHHPANTGDGPGKKANVVNKFRDNPRAQPAFYHALAADPNSQNGAEADQQHH